MKFGFSPQLMTTLILALHSVAIIYQPLMAQTDKYFCDKANNQGKNVPVTISTTVHGAIPLIYWVSSWGGVSPEQRCQEVSRRLQVAYENNLLKKGYITTGKVKDNSVICIRLEKGKDCALVIVTLKPQDNADAILEKMLDFRRRMRMGGVPLTDDLVFYDNGNTYIDIDIFLGKVDQENPKL